MNEVSTGATLSAAGIRAFFRIAEAWDLSEGEKMAAMGGVSRATLFNWKRDPSNVRLGVDQLDRLSYLIGIYKALQIVFTRSEQADGWIRRPNSAPPFGGKPAADLMFSGRMEDLMRVRRYLDGVRGVW